MKIEFTPIGSFDQLDCAASILELSAMVNGSGLIGDVQLDEEQLLAELKASPSTFQLEGEESFLEDEPFSAMALAKEIFEAKLSNYVLDREIFFDKAYPFECEGPNPLSLNLKQPDDRHPVGMAIVALSMFRLLQDQNVCQITKDDKTQFTKLFAPLFEVISTYALAGDRLSAVWWTGKSRGQRSFLRKLSRVIAFAGSGELRSKDELEPNQIGVNDGGVDGISISSNDGNIHADSICTLLGATIQQSNRRNKIVGNDALNRLKEFFKTRPNLVFNGLLAVPFPRSDSEAADCKSADCRYMPLETIESHLKDAATGNVPDALRSYRKRLDRNLAANVREICETLTLNITGQERKFGQF